MSEDTIISWDKPFDPMEGKIKQIVRNFVREITNGHLKPGDLMPTLREVAKTLGVARGTVEKAYALLKEMNLILTNVRKETRVWQHDSGKTGVAGQVINPGWRPVSSYPLYEQPKPYWTTYLSCSQQYPDVGQVSINSFGNAYAAVLHDMANGKGEKGKFDLKEELHHEAAALLDKREINMKGASFQLVPAREALLLTAAAVVPRGSFMIMDTPDDRQAFQAFSQLKLPVLFTGLDRDGMPAARAEALCRHYPVGALFVRSGVTRPYNVMMSDRRRQELIAVVKKYGTPVIEMDPDHELLFRPGLSPMAARDHGGLVILITSMSKLTAHMNETSLIVTNGNLAGLIARELQMADSWADPFHTLVQCRLINGNTIPLAAHRVLNVYNAFLGSVSELFNKFLKGKATLVPPPAGLQMWITLSRGIEKKALVPLLEDSGFQNPGGYLQHSPETKIYGLDLGMGSHDITQWQQLCGGLSKLL